jgi:hypothetical protein
MNGHQWVRVKLSSPAGGPKYRCQRCGLSYCDAPRPSSLCPGSNSVHQRPPSPLVTRDNITGELRAIRDVLLRIERILIKIAVQSPAPQQESNTGAQGGHE